MKALIAHDTAEALLAASRRSKSVRTGHRLLAIRDIMLGRARKWVCAQYGISRENLRHWIRWYNEEGSAGLADAVQHGSGHVVGEGGHVIEDAYFDRLALTETLVEARQVEVGIRGSRVGGVRPR